LENSESLLKGEFKVYKKNGSIHHFYMFFNVFLIFAVESPKSQKEIE